MMSIVFSSSLRHFSIGSHRHLHDWLRVELNELICRLLSILLLSLVLLKGSGTHKFEDFVESFESGRN